MAWLARLAGLAFIAIGAFILWSSRPGTPDNRLAKERNPSPGWTARPFGALAITFGLLVVAEMGDKSQLAVVGLAAKSDSPFSVFVVASIALTLVIWLAVLTGRYQGSPCSLDLSWCCSTVHPDRSAHIFRPILRVGFSSNIAELDSA